MERSDLAIIIPALNEADSIAVIVAGAARYGQVIVVDDGSTDSTGQISKEAGAEVVRHEFNMGYDCALEAGFTKAKELLCTYVITMDADGEHAIANLENFSKALKKSHLVLGVRPHKQRFAEVIMGIYFKLKYGIEDILCGMKGYHISVYEENEGFDHLKSIGTELALNTVRNGHEFCQVDVTGERRQSRPRFGGAIAGNYKILKALLQVANLTTIGPVKTTSFNNSE